MRGLFFGSILIIPLLGDFLDPLDQDQLNKLLHVAISHSNTTRLQEMAASGYQVDRSHVEQAISEDVIGHANKVFRDTVTFTLIDKVWETEEDFLLGLEFISDFGDHLIDKIDLLDKWAALDPLVQWVVGEVESDKLFHNPVIVARALDLLAEITQNRDSAKAIIQERYPGIVEAVVTRMDRIGCFGETSHPETCASYVSLLTALGLGNQTDSVVMANLAAHFSDMRPDPSFFPRYITLFRSLVSEASETASWVRAIQAERLVEKIGSQHVSVHVGHRLSALLGALPGNRVHELGAVNATLHAQCLRDKGDGHEWCHQFRTRDEL